MAMTRCATSRKLEKTRPPDTAGLPDIPLPSSASELAVIDNLSGKLYLIVYADPAPRGPCQRQSGLMG
jgi:hypothetical protein